MDQTTPPIETSDLAPQGTSPATFNIDQILLVWQDSLNWRWRIQNWLQFVPVALILGYFILKYIVGSHLPSIFLTVYPIWGLVLVFAWVYNRYLTIQTDFEIDNIADKRFVTLLIEMSARQ